MITIIYFLIAFGWLRDVPFVCMINGVLTVSIIIINHFTLPLLGFGNSATRTLTISFNNKRHKVTKLVGIKRLNQVATMTIMRQLIPSLRSASFRYAVGIRKQSLSIQRFSSIQCFPSTAVCPTCDLGSSETSMDAIETKLGDLVIDRKTPLRGLVPRHRVHLAISTGRSDWESNIELEPGTLAQGVKCMCTTASSTTWKEILLCYIIRILSL